MGLKKAFGAGLGVGLLFMGCAGFSYHYYGLDQVYFDQGKLVGPTPSDDLPFSRCAGHQCVVLLTQDFFSWKQDYEELKLRLSECEKRP